MMEHEIIVEKHFSNKTYNVSLVAWEKNGYGVRFGKEFNVSKTKAKKSAEKLANLYYAPIKYK